LDWPTYKRRCAEGPSMIGKDTICKMLFGSAARGDFDRYSDRDLLLVATRPDDLRAAAALYSAAGWSCSLYSWHTLKRLCSRGGFFVEHLRREGKLLRDLDDALAHQIAIARCKTSYSEEIEQARQLFGVIEFVPETFWGASWALDILMVAVRSFGYATLANRGMYVFNYNQMLGHLVNFGLLSRCARLQLAELRIWKVRYRKGHYCASWNHALPLICEADRLMKIDLHVRRLHPHQYVERAARGYCAEYGWYANIRSLEGVDKCVPRVLPLKVVSRLQSPQEYSVALSKIHFGALMRRALGVVEQNAA
jgi:hypothetical protein